VTYCVLDTETYLIEPGNIVPCVVSLGYMVSGGGADLVVGEKIEPTLTRLLDDRTTVFVGHNIAFDWAVLLRACPHLAPQVWQAYDEDRVWDTQLWDQLYHNAIGDLPRHKYSLAALAKRYLGKEVKGKEKRKGEEDPWRLRYAELDGVPLAQWPEEAVAYALNDVAVTEEIYALQVEDMPEGPPTFFDQVRAAWGLHLISAWGLRTDPTKVAAFEAKLNGIAAERDAYMKAQGVMREDGTKDLKKLREMVTEAYNGKPPRTAKGGVKTDRRALKDSGDPVLANLAEGGEVYTYRNTFLPALKRGTQSPICPSFVPLKETGRVACRNPNVQNLPRDDDLRSCFVPRSGWVYVGADYSVAELACFAQVLYTMQGRSKMKEALEEGKDLHLLTGASLLEISYEEMVRRYKAGDPQAKEVRTLAKVANFGFLGGLGKRFAAYAKNFGIEISEQRALEVRKKWLDTYPEIRPHFRVVSMNSQNVDGWTFVHPITGFIRGDVTYTQGANCYVQHLCAHGAKRALYHLVRATKVEPESPLFGCAVVNFIHDEFLLEVPEGRHHEAALELERLMVLHMKHYLTDIPIKAEGYAMNAWYKGAEPVWDEDKRLQVWTGS